MPDAATLKEWAEGWSEDIWQLVLEREKANASPQMIWYRRGQHAAYEHLMALIRKYPELDVPIGK